MGLVEQDEDGGRMITKASKLHVFLHLRGCQPLSDRVLGARASPHSHEGFTEIPRSSHLCQRLPPKHCRKLAEATLLGPLALSHGFKFAQTGLQEGQRELDTVAVQAAQEAATSAVGLRCRQEEEEE